MRQRISIENKILELFYENPSKQFTIREISRLTKVPRATAHKYVLELKKNNIISRENKAQTSLLFKIRKVNYFIEKIVISGMIDELVNELNPSCVILFGSIRKGDSTKESDIDLFVESSIKKQVSFKKFERKLKHKIQLFVKTDINNLHSNLFNNVINGIKLYGSLKLK